MKGNSLDPSVASRVGLTAFCWVAFATSKNLLFCAYNRAKLSSMDFSFYWGAQENEVGAAQLRG